MNISNTMQFSKKVELTNKIVLIVVILFAAISWFVYHDIPDFVTWVIGAAGIGDVAYNYNSATEKKALAAKEAAIAVAQMDIQEREPGDC